MAVVLMIASLLIVCVSQLTGKQIVDLYGRFVVGNVMVIVDNFSATF